MFSCCFEQKCFVLFSALLAIMLMLLAFLALLIDTIEDYLNIG